MRHPLLLAIVIGLGIVIAYQSLDPRGVPGEVDKLLHFSAYAVWGVFAVLATPAGRARRLLLGVLLAAGAAIELVQPAFGRSASMWDALANFAGLAVGAFAAVSWKDRAVPLRLRTFGLVAGAAALLAVGAAAAAPVWTRHGLDNWDCDHSMVVGDEIGGNRPWKGELLCARLYAGNRRLEPDGDTAPACGAPMTHPHAVAVLEVGTRSVFGTPDAAAPRRDDATKAFCRAARSAETLVVEAWVRSAAAKQFGPARILTFSASIHERNLTLAQDGSRYDLRLRTLATGENGMAVSIATPKGTVVPGSVQHLVAWYRDPVAELSLSDGTGSGPIRVSRTVSAAVRRAASAIALLGGAILTVGAVLGAVEHLRARTGGRQSSR